MSNMAWTFSKVWNDSLTLREDYPLRPRDYFWASELAGSFIDRWYKMKATKPSNPFDPRSKRKFEAGHLFEWIVNMVLRRAGILIEVQERAEFQYDGLCKVTGRLDQRAGGNPDWERAKVAFADGEFPDFIKTAANRIVEYFSANYPKGLKTIILETKSVGSQKFHAYQNFNTAQDNHRLQLFHYLKSLGFDEGHVIYISKDDLCIVEIPVFVDEKNETDYRADIQQMTDYLKSDTPPPLERPVVFDSLVGRFSVNYKVSYSQYLTMLYGYKNQGDFDSKYKPQVAKWNRTLGRVADDKNMTDLNKESIEEIRAYVDDFDSIINITKGKRAILKALGEEQEDAVD